MKKILKNIVIGSVSALPFLYLFLIILDRNIFPSIERVNQFNEVNNNIDSSIESKNEDAPNSIVEVIPDVPIYPYELSTSAKVLLECGISQNYPLTLQNILTQIADMRSGDNYSEITLALQEDDIRDAPDAMAVFAEALNDGIGFNGFDSHVQLRNLSFNILNDAFNAGSIHAGYQLAQGYIYYSSGSWQEYPDLNRETINPIIEANLQNYKSIYGANNSRSVLGGVLSSSHKAPP